jgi:PTS system nitrogen regulatory IIA component
MSAETLDLLELAHYLQRDARDLAKLASQGRIPARRVSGDWRFSRAEVNDWLEQEMPSLTDVELVHVECGVQGGKSVQHYESRPLLSNFLHEDTTAIPLSARTGPGVLSELVSVANGTWQIYDPERVLEAVRVREEAASTVLPCGVALPHPRRCLSDCLGESILAVGRSTTPVPFSVGGKSGGVADLFFLLLCKDERTHLQTLARLTRILQRDDCLASLRAAHTAGQLISALVDAEAEVLP